MGTLYIRGIDDSVLAKLDDLAKSKGMSRNAYVKKYVQSLAVLSDLKELDSKYAVLVKNMSSVLEQTVDYLKRNEDLLLILNKKINEKGK